VDLLHLIILTIVQGLTEFLPISSSAHLILLPLLAGWQDQGLAIDVAAHFGSLFAVVTYLRKDIIRLCNAGIASISRKECNTTDSKLFWYIVTATLPVLLAGFLLGDIVSTYLRDPLVIAAASICFGALLLLADIKGKRRRIMSSMTLRDSIIIGLAQAVALIPGTSRSGITMTAALMLGLDRNTAARFSFLMAIPVILAASAYESLKLIHAPSGVDVINVILVVVLSAACALLAIHYFLKFLDRVGMMPFVIYRVLLGLILIILFI